MQSIQQKLDTIANNMANINTNGYKRRDVFFQDILSARMDQPQEFQLNGRLTPLGIDQGAGSRVALTMAHFDQGQSIDTGVATDLLINGDDVFFQYNQLTIKQQNIHVMAIFNSMVRVI